MIKSMTIQCPKCKEEFTISIKEIRDGIYVMSHCEGYADVFIDTYCPNCNENISDTLYGDGQ